MDQQKYACSKCQRTFTTKRRLLGHMENRHKGNPIDGPKESCYTVQDQGSVKRYQCDICQKLLSSKQRILGHLERVHFKSPASKVYKKRNLHDAVPKTTQWRSRKVLFGDDNKDQGNITESSSVLVNDNVSEQRTSSSQDFDNTSLFSHDTDGSNSSSVQGEFDFGSDEERFYVESESVSQFKNPEAALQSKPAIHNISASEHSEIGIMEEGFRTDNESNFADSDVSIGDSSFSSESDSDSSESDGDSSKSSELHTDDDEYHSSHTDMDLGAEQSMSEIEMKAYCKYAFASKHHLSVEANKDLSKLLKVCSDSECEYPGLTKNETNFKVIHYCLECFNIFPSAPAVNECTLDGCNGQRYQRNGQPMASFVMADIKQQLTQLFERCGIWDSIQETKHRIKHNSNDLVNDITDGSAYRQHCADGEFLSHAYHLSAIFNTDGIPLYTSSKVKLWPIFLAVNELPVTCRFARENLLVAGIWQGKSNPPFQQYLNEFGKQMNHLYDHGITIKLPGQKTIDVKIQLLCGTLDLQAKAYVSNMTMHNGAYGCSTCEEPGTVVRQGKGHTRMYPYKREKPKQRVSDDIKQNKAPAATRSNRLTGICGMSGLSVMPYFDLVDGLVPDYMHGVLLGTTKSLMYLWFSSTKARQPYFIGNSINDISRRLQSICPPDYVERLPRDLEKNYANLKATELQTWLLYYAVPCLDGILPQEFLSHLCLLSHGIYILLSNNISQSDLDLSEKLLSSFYQQFCSLYPEGSCGLNVHNIGAHLVAYVRKWGPLWGWSCFPFEDANAAILDAVHGTGDITKQYLNIKSLEGKLAQIDLNSCPTASGREFLEKMRRRDRNWSSNYQKKMENCYVTGTLVSLKPQETSLFVLNKTGVEDGFHLKKSCEYKSTAKNYTVSSMEE